VRAADVIVHAGVVGQVRGDPHAVAVCAERVPAWEEAEPGRWVACHRWPDFPS